MTYHEKMIYHVEQAEAVGTRIDREEAEFLAKYRRRTSNEPPNAVERQAMKSYFKEDGFYQSLGSKQAHHVSMATMYGIAAQALIAELVEASRLARMFPNATQED